jgi:N-acetylmuramoyl-L-alanine amidase
MKNIATLLGYTPTLYIDDGHGMETAGKRTPVMPDGSIIRENEFNRPTANKLEAMAKAVGFRVVQSAPELNEPGLTVRSTRINTDYAAQRKVYPAVPWDKLAVGVSIHFNAFDGVMDSKGRQGGVDVFYHATSAPGKQLATIVLKHLVQGTPQVNRGIKDNNLHMTRETTPVFIICECGFMDVLKEAQLMKNEAFQTECATEILAGVCEYYGHNLEDLRTAPAVPAKTPIIGKTTATIAQAQAWAKAKNATQLFIDLAPTFWKVSEALGINPVGIYCQAAKETGYMKFGGVIDATYFNTCGLKITAGGGNYDPAAHKRFKDWEEGITAHVDHAALYAGAPGYPKAGTPDPRHFPYLKGTAPNWEDLGGKWAPNVNYGKDIAAMMKDLEGTKAPAAPVPDIKQAEIDSLRKQLEAMTSRTVAAEAKLKQINAISKLE